MVCPSTNQILKNLLVYLFCFRLLLAKLFGLFLLIYYAGTYQQSTGFREFKLVHKSTAGTRQRTAFHGLRPCNVRSWAKENTGGMQLYN